MWEGESLPEKKETVSGKPRQNRRLCERTFYHGEDRKASTRVGDTSLFSLILFFLAHSGGEIVCASAFWASENDDTVQPIKKRRDSRR